MELSNEQESRFGADIAMEFSYEQESRFGTEIVMELGMQGIQIMSRQWFL